MEEVSTDLVLERQLAILKIKDEQIYDYELDIKIPPKSKMLEHIIDVDGIFSFNDLRFDTGILATVDHSMDVNIRHRQIDINLRFRQPLDPKFTCKINLVENGVVRSTLPVRYYKRKSNLGDLVRWKAICNQPFNSHTFTDRIDTVRVCLVVNHYINQQVVKTGQNFNNGGLSKFYLSQELSDVIIECANTANIEFYAHKLLLASKSSVFESMFKEHDNRVKLEGINSLELKAFLRYFYEGNVFEVEGHLAVPLLKAAYKYNVQELKSHCERVLIRQLSPSNALGMQILADKCDALLLKEKANVLYKGTKNKRASSTISNKSEIQEIVKEGVQQVVEVIQ